MSKPAPKNHNLSPYCLFFGRAISLYIATQRLRDSHRDLPQDAILYPAQPNKYEFPLGLAERAKRLLQHLQDYKGYTPATPELQSALDGLALAILSLRDSVTTDTKAEEKFQRARASSGFLMAFLNLKKLHESALGGV